MALGMYLKTPWNNGDVTAKGYEGWSEVLAWSWGASLPVSFVTSPPDFGRLSVGSLSITKYLDQASVNMGLDLVNPKGRSYELANVNGSGAEVLKFRMLNTFVESLSTGASGGEDRNVENVTLAFQRFTSFVTATDWKGATSTRSWSYDQITAAESPP